MLAEIEYFINNHCIEDMKGVLKDSFNLLDELDVQDYIVSFNELFMNESDREVLDLVPNFVSIIDTMIVDLLKLHGVVLNEEATLSFKNKILEGIIELPDYSDKNSLLVILETQEDEIEKFCHLMKHVTSLDFMDLFSFIESIDPAIFTKLLTIINGINNSPDLHEEDHQNIKVDIITKLKLIRKMIDYDKAVGFTLVNNGSILGSSFDQYSGYAIKHFDLFTPDIVAKELFVLLTLSEEGYNNPLLVFRKYSQNLFSDLDRITKIDVCLNRLIMQYDKSLLQPQLTQV